MIISSGTHPAGEKRDNWTGGRARLTDWNHFTPKRRYDTEKGGSLDNRGNATYRCWVASRLEEGVVYTEKAKGSELGD